MSGSIHLDAVSTLQQLGRLRSVEPRETARFEERIRFALVRLDELRRPGSGRARPVRLAIARDILDEHLRRADEFIASAASEADVLRVA